jgi:hypothetical protein
MAVDGIPAVRRGGPWRVAATTIALAAVGAIVVDEVVMSACRAAGASSVARTTARPMVAGPGLGLMHLVVGLATVVSLEVIPA